MRSPILFFEYTIKYCLKHVCALCIQYGLSIVGILLVHLRHVKQKKVFVESILHSSVHYDANKL